MHIKDLFLDLFSIFCLLQILALFSHLCLSQVILMPMTFNPTNIAQHLRQLLQSELCPRPLMLSMPGCHLIACCKIQTKLSIFVWAPASSWTSWTLSPLLLNSLPFSSPLLSGILGSSWTKNCLSVST